MSEAIVRPCHVVKNFPWIFPTVMKLPGWVVGYLFPPFAIAMEQRKTWTQQVLDLKSGMYGEKRTQKRSSVFETALESDAPPPHKSVNALTGDAQALLGGGTITTGTTLTLATYYVLEDSNIHQRLMNELSTITTGSSQIPTLADIEKLDYVTAVLLETLRISYGVSHRLARVSPDQILYYYEWAIPAGTPVGMSALHIHDNAGFFPEPRAFKPERWLPLATEGRRLQKYLVPFSRGSRQCLGMNLAWAEMYMAFAAVFGRLGNRMQLVDTVKERDVDLVHDLFVAAPSKQSTGIKIQIREATSS